MSLQVGRSADDILARGSVPGDEELAVVYTPKDKVRVCVCTSLYRIVGDMYVLPGSRITDIMNVKAKDFIPVTNAVFYHPYEGRAFAQVAYTAVNRDSILMVFPTDEGPAEEEAATEGSA